MRLNNTGLIAVTTCFEGEKGMDKVRRQIMKKKIYIVKTCGKMFIGNAAPARDQGREATDE